MSPISSMSEIAVPLVLGIGFGALLHRAGLTHYARIVGIYRLRDWTVLRFMLSALLVGGVLVQLAQELGWARPIGLPMANLGADLGGGFVFGIGMALAGFCPGTIVAAGGEGHLDALVFGVLGLLAGALGFGLIAPRLAPIVARLGALGRRSLPDVLDASPWLVLLLFAELVALALYFTSDRPRSATRPRNDECDESVRNQ